MSKFLFIKLNPLFTTRAIAPVSTHNLLYYFLQSHPFSTSLSSSSAESIENSLNPSSFTVDYLINSCGFTPNKAISASKFLKFELAYKPDSVLTFFKDHGFTSTQTLKLVNSFPRVLLSNPEKTLLPKLEFLKSKGFSESDIAEIICKWPNILSRSLENQLIPAFNFFSNLLQSSERKKINRCVGVLLFDLEKHGTKNIEILKKVGVPLKNIWSLLTNNPRVFRTNCDNFKQTVDEVIKMGFAPCNVYFTIAIHALRSMTKSTWNRKVGVYKKWGWSEDDVIAAFRRSPWCMIKSENKITSVMEFWVNKMGWKSSLLVNNPLIMVYNLEKRTAPRCEVYQFLVGNSLLNPTKTGFATMVSLTEDRFLKRFVEPHKGEFPDLLKLYKQKLDLAK